VKQLCSLVLSRRRCRGSALWASGPGWAGREGAASSWCSLAYSRARTGLANSDSGRQARAASAGTSARPAFAKGMSARRATGGLVGWAPGWRRGCRRPRGGWGTRAAGRSACRGTGASSARRACRRRRSGAAWGRASAPGSGSRSRTTEHCGAVVCKRRPTRATLSRSLEVLPSARVRGPELGRGRLRAPPVVVEPVLGLVVLVQVGRDAALLAQRLPPVVHARLRAAARQRRQRREGGPCRLVHREMAASKLPTFNKLPTTHVYFPFPQ